MGETQFFSCVYSTSIASKAKCYDLYSAHTEIDRERQTDRQMMYSVFILTTCVHSLDRQERERERHTHGQTDR